FAIKKGGTPGIIASYFHPFSNPASNRPMAHLPPIAHPAQALFATFAFHCGQKFVFIRVRLSSILSAVVLTKAEALATEDSRLKTLFPGTRSARGPAFSKSCA